jgi:hypothetical protein
MFEQATNPAGTGFDYAAASPPPPPILPAYDLRPLTTGEILDRTFSLYRQRFWLYCGLSAIAAGVVTMTSLAQMIWLDTRGYTPKLGATPDTAAALKTMLVTYAIGLVASLFHLVAYSMTQAATVSAVSSVYLGHETSMGIAFKAVRRFWLRYVGIALWQFWSAMWIFVLLFVPAIMVLRLSAGAAALGGFLMLLALGSLIYGIIAYIRNSLAVAVSVFETQKVRPSMRRSKTLAAQTKWRIFLLLLLLFVLSMVAGGFQVPFVIFLQRSHSGERFIAQGLSLVIAFVTNSLIGPIGAIGLCLIYFDQRVRKEGFDIEALMDGTLGAARPVFAAPVWAQELLPTGFAPSGFTASSAPFLPTPPGLAPTSAAPFPPSGLRATDAPFAPSGLTASEASPPPAESTASSSPFAPSGFTAPDTEHE